MGLMLYSIFEAVEAFLVLLLVVLVPGSMAWFFGYELMGRFSLFGFLTGIGLAIVFLASLKSLACRG